MSTAVSEDRLWAAIGEPSRRRLLDVLLVQGEATPTVLATQLPYSRQAVAKHLAVLEGVGLVEPRREGREVHYTIQTKRLAEAIEVISRVAEDWDGRLLAIKRIAEQIHREQTRSR